jgi:hypothetical protein
MSLVHPCIKCFFFRKRELLDSCIFEADSALKSRGFGDLGSPSGREEIIENCCETNVRGLSSVR